MTPAALAQLKGLLEESQRQQVNAAIREIVRQVIHIEYGHWLKHGTPIKREDVDLVMQDVVPVEIIGLFAQLHTMAPDIITAYEASQRRVEELESEYCWHVPQDFPRASMRVEVQCDDGSIRKAYREPRWDGDMWVDATMNSFWSLAHPKITAWRYIKS